MCPGPSTPRKFRSLFDIFKTPTNYITTFTTNSTSVNMIIWSECNDTTVQADVSTLVTLSYRLKTQHVREMYCSISENDFLKMK